MSTVLVVVIVAGAVFVAGIALLIVALATRGAPKQSAQPRMAADASPTAPDTAPDTAPVIEAPLGTLAPDATPCLPADLPDTADGHLAMGAACLALGRLEQSVGEFEAGLAAAQSNADKLRISLRMGDLLTQHGLHRPAMAAYIQAGAYTEDPAVQTRIQTLLEETERQEAAAAEHGSASVKEG